MSKNQAILLLGPTGSGKTPLGIYLEQKSMLGKRCFHFDFGNELRNIVEGNVIPSEFTSGDIDYIKEVLKTGALLENETFYIAEKILSSFITGNSITDNDLIILNGLPRHIDQAKDVDTTVEIKMVLYLECSPEPVRERIRLNSGRDRSARIDDSIKEVDRKLNIFHKRTAPLLHYYQNKNIPVKKIVVTVTTTPAEILNTING